MKKKLVWLIVLAVLLAGIAAFALYGEEIIAFLFPVRNDWVDKDGVIYYHDEDGDPVTGWFLHDGNSYYLDPAREGAMVTGWLTLDGTIYYLDEQGHLASGWQEIEGKTYYLWENGAMATGWLELEDGTYYLSEDGTPAAGWLEEDGCKYYLGDSGLVAVGWLDLDGSRYYFEESGVMRCGWLEAESGTYYLDTEGRMVTGWQTIDEFTSYFGEDGIMATGWLDLDGKKYYLGEDGHCTAGWVETEEGKYYINADGSVHTGWLDLDGKRYYMKEDGSMAVGRVLIDDVARYFTSTGAYVVLVNRWNPVPEDYTVDLVTFNGWQVDSSCYEDLKKMLSDCPYGYTITSAYRSKSSQQSIWNRRMATHQANGYSYNGALALTAAYVAVPGTSEHQLGLAVDISGASAQKWLEEHCWEYGFILRYLDGKSEATGIAYEKWHFRYVGVELAMELKDSGLCLEEYMDSLTADGSTASNPETAADTDSSTADTEPTATEAAA